MQKQNLSEYAFIRKELAALRNCITTYMGFVIGGSSITLISTIMLSKEIINNSNAALVFFISSLMVSLVLIILFYKFNSHNRHSGYCKLLNQEKYKSKRKRNQFLSWEVCMDVLREMEDDKALRNQKIDFIINKRIMEGIGDKIRSVYENQCLIKRISKGAQYIIKTISWMSGSKSWNFPLYVVAVFLTIEVLLVSAGLFHFFSQHVIIWDSFQSISIICISIAQVFIWLVLFNRIYDLMEGKRTINSYCYRFLLVRYEYIYSWDNDVDYKLITLKN